MNSRNIRYWARSRSISSNVQYCSMYWVSVWIQIAKFCLKTLNLFFLGKNNKQSSRFFLVKKWQKIAFEERNWTKIYFGHNSVKSTTVVYDLPEGHWYTKTNRPRGLMSWKCSSVRPVPRGNICAYSPLCMDHSWARL